MVKVFKWVAYLEGISFLVLLGIAMPLKYMYNQPEMVRIVGMAHGVLFMAYVYLTFFVKNKLGLSNLQVFYCLVGSVLPFGPFVVDRKYIK